MKSACALVAVMSLMTSAEAKEYRRLPGTTDWADPSSYGVGEWGTTPLAPDAPLPGAGDAVYVNGSGVTNFTIAVTNAVQWAVFNSFGSLRIAKDKRVIIDVPEGEAELKVRTNYRGWTTSYNYEHGGIVKRGSGTLVFDTPHSGDSRSDHECYVEVEEGAVALTRKAVEEGYSNYSYGKFTLAAGTKLYLPRSENHAPYFRTTVWGFDGEGTVVAEDPGTSIYIQGRPACVFTGTFEGDMSCYVGGNQTFANPNNLVRSVIPNGVIEQEGGMPGWNDEGPSFVKSAIPASQPRSARTRRSPSAIQASAVVLSTTSARARRAPSRFTSVARCIIPSSSTAARAD